MKKYNLNFFNHLILTCLFVAEKKVCKQNQTLLNWHSQCLCLLVFSVFIFFSKIACFRYKMNLLQYISFPVWQTPHGNESEVQRHRPTMLICPHWPVPAKYHTSVKIWPTHSHTQTTQPYLYPSCFSFPFLYFSSNSISFTQIWPSNSSLLSLFLT